MQLFKKLQDRIGVDAVIITAATKSNVPIENAIEYCRKKVELLQ